jgi:hypothetical protein
MRIGRCLRDAMRCDAMAGGDFPGCEPRSIRPRTLAVNIHPGIDVTSINTRHQDAIHTHVYIQRVL